MNSSTLLFNSTGIFWSFGNVDFVTPGLVVVSLLPFVELKEVTPPNPFDWPGSILSGADVVVDVVVALLTVVFAGIVNDGSVDSVLIVEPPNPLKPVVLVLAVVNDGFNAEFAVVPVNVDDAVAVGVAVEGNVNFNPGFVSVVEVVVAPTVVDPKLEPNTLVEPNEPPRGSKFWDNGAPEIEDVNDDAGAGVEVIGALKLNFADKFVTGFESKLPRVLAGVDKVVPPRPPPSPPPNPNVVVAFVVAVALDAAAVVVAALAPKPLNDPPNVDPPPKPVDVLPKPPPPPNVVELLIPPNVVVLPNVCLLVAPKLDTSGVEEPRPLNPPNPVVVAGAVVCAAAGAGVDTAKLKPVEGKLLELLNENEFDGAGVAPKAGTGVTPKAGAVVAPKVDVNAVVLGAVAPPNPPKPLDDVWFVLVERLNGLDADVVAPPKLNEAPTPLPPKLNAGVEALLPVVKVDEAVVVAGIPNPPNPPDPPKLKPGFWFIFNCFSIESFQF